MSRRGSSAMLADVATATAVLLQTLTPEQWQSPSLCSAWTVREVAGHLVSGTQTPLATVAATMIRARGRFHAANTADARRISGDTTTAGLITAVADPHRAGVGRFLPARLLLGDHVVHLLDIAHAIDRTITLPDDALAAVLLTELRLPNPFVPAARLGRGLTIDAPDIGWRHDRDGPMVQGNAADLISALAGRPATLHRLDGAGVDTLRARIHAWNT